MNERRVLLLALVTDIHDSAVAYPSCLSCNSKLLVDPTTERYHCIRCKTSCNKSKVQWRYRLVLTLADGTSSGRVVVFGRTLDGFFGKTATDFHRSLNELEQTGYPASSMLSEALLRTFHGKYFYFGFKMTGFQNSAEPFNLKHVIGSEISLCHSQLDCTSNFENSHTLAYQMLACSDAVYATVTDHMRVLVKLLRNQNQTKEVRSADSNQSCKPLKETDFAKSYTCSLYKYGDSLGSCKTLSFGEDQDSVRFSFEASSSTSQSCSIKEDIGKSVRQNSVSLERSLKFEDQEKTVETLLIKHDSDSKSKEIFLASGELDTKQWPSCVTFDSFTEESCVPLVETCSDLVCSPPDSNCLKHNLKRNCSFGLTDLYAYGNHGKTFSGLSIIHRLDFNTSEEDDALITSKRIDDELKRRECLSVHKNLSCKAINQPVDNFLTNGSIMETKHYQCGPATQDFKDISKESTAVYEAKDTRNSGEKERPILFSILPVRNHRALNEIQMPDSEELDAFFESQFDDIEFTKEVTSVVSGKSEENENMVNLNVEKYTGDVAKIETSGMVEANEFTNGLEKELPPTCYQAGNREKNKLHEVNTDFLYLPDSEDIGDFFDSFEDYLLEEKENCENHEETNDAERQGKEINACKMCSEISEKTNVCFSKITVVSENILLAQKRDFDKIIDEPMKQSNTTFLLHVNSDNDDEHTVEPKAHTTDKEKLILSSAAEDNHKETKSRMYDEVENVGNENNRKCFAGKDIKNRKLVSEYMKNRTIVSEDVKNREEITDSFHQGSLHRASKTRDKNTNYGRVREAELRISEHEKNEPDNLEKCFENISKNEICSKNNEVENTCHLSVSDQLFNEYGQENLSMKLEEVAQTAIDIAENGENDTSDFLRELSQISLNGVENSHISSVRVDNYSHLENEHVSTKFDVQLNYKGEDEYLKICPVENITIKHIDVKQNVEDNSNFDNTDEFEQTTKSECKPVLNLFQFSRCKNLRYSIHTAGKSVLSAEKESTISDMESEIGVEKSNQAVNTTSCEVFTNVNNSLAGKLEIISEGVCVTVNEQKFLKDESGCADYSGDLFEISRAECEVNSQCILTVCTPSLNSTAFSENLNLNEVIFEESPLGTSTPGLDECILLDSQGDTGTVMSGIKSNMFDHLGSKRKVKFDKRLRRVSSCRLMDIRMKLNDSPLNTLPQYTLKSCLKSLKEQNFRVQKTEHLGQKQAKDISGKQNIVKEGTDVYQDLTNEKNDTEQNKECLDGSADLFGECFITSAKENLIQPVQMNKKMRQKTDTIRIEEDNVGKEKDIEYDSEDLWLNESSDSLVFEAAHNVDDMDIDKGIKLVTDTDNLKNAQGEVNLMAERPESPDLFSSQSDTGVISDGKSTFISQPVSFKQTTLIKKDKQIPCPVKDSVWKDCKREALKPLVVNTPDYGSSSSNYLKQRTSGLKSKNQSLTRKNYGNQNVPQKMEENLVASESPDIFGDSIDDLDQNFVCDKNLVKRSNFLCKKLLF